MKHSSHPLGPRLRLRVTPAAESVLRAGHPWVFADSIHEQNRPGQLGELAVLYDKHDKFLAVGLFDPQSPIRVRLLHLGRPQTFDRHWWTARLCSAAERRLDLFDDRTTGFRWINGESDGWPGLVLDRYAETLVLKLYTAAWLPRLSEIQELVQAQFHPERLVLRLSRNIQKLAREQFHATEGQLLGGLAFSGPVLFLENGLRFEADVLNGQKTGFFLDQRDNRRKVETLARGRTVLNAFSFSGGFSLYAARGGAATAADLDLSRHALRAAERNFALNQGHPAVAACAHETIQAEAFEWLAGNRTRRFSLVILDPPSLAKRESERAGALRAYERLAALAIQHLSPDGILLACSCSAHVPAPDFFQAVRRAAARLGHPLHELETTGHAPDHPSAFKEAQYLKAIYLGAGASTGRKAAKRSRPIF